MVTELQAVARIEYIDFRRALLDESDFQLRAFGAKSPSVSFSWNIPSSRSSRHPVIVVAIDRSSSFAAPRARP